MIARRLVTSLVLAALIGNVSVLAGSSVGLVSGREGQGFTVVSLRHETVGATTRIQVESSAPPLYAVFRPTDRLIIVDLPGCAGSQLEPEYTVHSALVDSVSIKQSSTAGTSVRAATRLEVAVRPDAHDRTSVSGNVLTLEFSPEAQASTARPATQNNAESTGVYVLPTPVSGAKQPAASKPAASQPSASDTATPKPAALRAATVIRDVRSEASAGGLRIVVDSDGALQYKDFILSDPWRVVVDITGVRSAIGNRVTNVAAASIDPLRIGQPSANVVRIVLDAKSKVNYQVVRDGQQLVITVGNPSSRDSDNKPAVESRPPANGVVQKAPAQPDAKSELKVAGERIENKTDNTKSADTADSNLIAQAKGSAPSSKPAQVTPAPNRNLPPAPAASQPANKPVAPAAQPVSSSPRGTLDVQRQSNILTDPRAKGQMAVCDPNYTGGLISFDLRAGVDLRDMLRFISQQYGVNFIIDKSVSSVPVDIRVTDIPWNHVMDSVLRANRLGAVCESNGRMIRIATLSAIKEEEDQRKAMLEAQSELIPLTTKIIHLKYARAVGSLSASGRGGSGSSGGGGGNSQAGGGGGQGQGTLLQIVRARLSKRGKVEIDARTNSLILTDLPEYMQVMEDMIAKLDRPEPQVEIEARIVIANRNFLRDIGVELATAVTGSRGKSGIFETSPAQLNGSGLAQGGQNAGGSGGSGGSSGGTGSGSGSGSGSSQQKGLGPNLLGPFADGSLRAAANSVLGLTTGVFGTAILSTALSASETKGQIRTIASPRVTTTDNKTAEIVNGVQIPVQTVSNNTITTTFVTAALRLEITPQIIEENGQVLMHVVAENNNVNFSLANQFNNGTPGIDTQSAESTVLVADGGTTVMGGINIDSESHSMNRTPGVSKVPILGELFKRRTVRRDANEILFFLTPRIVRQDVLGNPAPQRSSMEGAPAPVQPRTSVAQGPTQPKTQPAAVAAGKPSGK